MRERAVTLGKIADILTQRGQTEEALRIFEDELLPFFERLGDVRSRAVTLGKIADILTQRGQTEEALTILIDECLPIRTGIQDLSGIAHIRYSCAQIRLQRGGLEQEDLKTIFEELAESFGIYLKLQRVDGIAFVGRLFGQILAAAGNRDEALDVLDHSVTAFEKMEQPEMAEQVRELQKQIRERST